MENIRKINLQNNIQVFGCPSRRKSHASKPPAWTKKTFIVFLWSFFVFVTKCFFQSILFFCSTEVTEVWSDKRLNKWWQILFLEGNLPSDERWKDGAKHKEILQVNLLGESSFLGRKMIQNTKPNHWSS